MEIDEGWDYMEAHGIKEIVLHAPYIINLGNCDKPDQVSFGIDFMREEIARADALGAKQMTFHPGAHVGAGPDRAFDPDMKVKLMEE